MFGGNNSGGVTTSANVDLDTGVYGSVFGGGRMATTNVTNVELSGVTVNNVVYGGGDQAQVNTNTSVNINSNSSKTREERLNRSLIRE